MGLAYLFSLSMQVQWGNIVGQVGEKTVLEKQIKCVILYCIIIKINVNLRMYQVQDIFATEFLYQLMHWGLKTMSAA